jgi:hypothetical protein
VRSRRPLRQANWIDFTAKLVDVHPGGYAQNLLVGIIRARYRIRLYFIRPIWPPTPPAGNTEIAPKLAGLRVKECMNLILSFHWTSRTLRGITDLDVKGV